ncbi:MAG TPA: hypothetical protein VMT15_04215 [Bryobacteraceae bacterium]|nr:hypothetical protein [Bryobacteraceae bacterium]
MRFACLLLLIPPLLADDLTNRMRARVSEEAEAFQRLAPEVLGEETLHQRSLKPPSRFHPRAGAAATTPPKPQYQERTIVSEYGYATLAGGSFHELRQATSVDGRKVEDTKKAQAALAKAITGNDDGRKLALLRQFEKMGLIGAVTDYGQALLLFTRQNLERYEFVFKGENWLGGQKVRVFGYRQLDGPEALTLIEEKNNDKVRHLRIEGELWVMRDSLVPVRVILSTSQGAGAESVKEEASVDYAMSPYGALLPVKTEHRETRAGKIAAENNFFYANFKKFGASSDITFEPAKQ